MLYARTRRKKLLKNTGSSESRSFAAQPIRLKIFKVKYVREKDAVRQAVGTPMHTGLRHVRPMLTDRALATNGISA
jgi:hypothetical protein